MAHAYDPEGERFENCVVELDLTDGPGSASHWWNAGETGADLPWGKLAKKWTARREGEPLDPDAGQDKPLPLPDVVYSVRRPKPTTEPVVLDADGAPLAVGDLVEGNVDTDRPRDELWHFVVTRLREDNRFDATIARVPSGRGQGCQLGGPSLIACENVGASWLPFEPLRRVKSQSRGGVQRWSSEAVWTSG